MQCFSDLLIGGGTLLFTDCSTLLLIDCATLLLISKMNSRYISVSHNSWSFICLIRLGDDRPDQDNVWRWQGARFQDDYDTRLDKYISNTMISKQCFLCIWFSAIH